MFSPLSSRSGKSEPRVELAKQNTQNKKIEPACLMVNARGGGCFSFHWQKNQGSLKKTEKLFTVPKINDYKEWRLNLPQTQIF